MNIDKILKELTLEEKASLCSGSDFWHTEEIKRLDIPSIMVSDGPHGLRKCVMIQTILTKLSRQYASHVPAHLPALLTESCLQLSARLLARSVRLRTFPLYLVLAVT